jgi:hypothetical protein
LIVAACPSVGSTAQVHETEVDIIRANDLLKGMRDRAKQAGTFAIHWNESSNLIGDPAQLAERLARSAAEIEDPSAAAFAAETAIMAISMQQGSEFRLVADGPKLRMDRFTFEASRIDPGELVRQRTLAAFDGQFSKWVVLERSGDYPIGVISNETDPVEFRYISSIPVFVAFRSALWLNRLGSYDATTRWGELGDTSLVKLELATRSSDPHISRYVLWCDPTKSFQALRIEKWHGPTLRRRWDLRYEVSDDSASWLPDSWEMLAWSADGHLNERRQSEVTECRVGQEVASTEFEIVFPPGALVYDRTRQEEYILLHNHQKQYITDAHWDAGMTYQEILKSTNRSTSEISQVVGIVISGAFLILLTLFWLWRRYWRLRTVL